MPTVPPARPSSIQGRRIPNREVVRSLSLPDNGLANRARNEPAANVSARRPGASSAPTRSPTFNASVTSNGAISIKQLAVNASA